MVCHDTDGNDTCKILYVSRSSKVLYPAENKEITCNVLKKSEQESETTLCSMEMDICNNQKGIENIKNYFGITPIGYQGGQDLKNDVLMY